MTRPVRVQLSRKKGWRMPPHTVRVARPSRWGNPFYATQTYITFYLVTEAGSLRLPLAMLRKPASLDRCLDLYTAWLYAHIQNDPKFLWPLAGKNLACWCPLDQPCHADVLLELANK